MCCFFVVKIDRGGSPLELLLEVRFGDMDAEPPNDGPSAVGLLAARFHWALSFGTSQLPWTDPFLPRSAAMWFQVSVCTVGLLIRC